MIRTTQPPALDLNEVSVGAETTRYLLSPIDEKGAFIRQGSGFQAELPDSLQSDGLEGASLNGSSDAAETERCYEIALWRPPPDGVDFDVKQVEELISWASTRNFAVEQVMGVLMLRNYDVASARQQLELIGKIDDQWNAADAVHFEHALRSKGKDFHAIARQLTDKSTREVIKFYYDLKQMRRREELLAIIDGPEQTSDEPDKNEQTTAMEYDDDKLACSNCGSTSEPLTELKKGLLCGQCLDYWQRTGTLRSHGLSPRPVDPNPGQTRHGPKGGARLPDGLHFDRKDFLEALASSADSANDPVLDELEQREKRLVADNSAEDRLRKPKEVRFEEFRLRWKQLGCRLGLDTEIVDIEASESCEPEEETFVSNDGSVWSSSEVALLLNALQANRAPDYDCVAALFPQRSEEAVRSFMASNGRLFGDDLNPEAAVLAANRAVAAEVAAASASADAALNGSWNEASLDDDLSFDIGPF